MTIFADASALIGLIADDPESDRLVDLIEADPSRLYSALSAWESVAGLCRSYAFSVAAARAQVGRFLEAGGFRIVAMGERESRIALDAYDRYGKGRHQAALNMGDCFAYACARANGAKLLFKGDDFTRTDIEAAG